MSSWHTEDMWLMPVSVRGQRQGVFCECSDQPCYLTSSHSLSMSLSKPQMDIDCETVPEAISLEALSFPILCQSPASLLALCALVLPADTNRRRPCSSEHYLSIATLSARPAEGTSVFPICCYSASCLQRQILGPALRLQPLLPGKLIQSLDFCILSFYDPYSRFTWLVWKAPLSLQAWNKQPACHLPWDLKDLRCRCKRLPRPSPTTPPVFTSQ